MRYSGSNPEMQKRVANVIRAMAEGDINPIVSIHDHGAGGHLNCLSELVETQGGKIYIDQLPVGDPSLSAKEIISNESQERMGLLVKPGDIDGFARSRHAKRLHSMWWVRRLVTWSLPLRSQMAASPLTYSWGASLAQPQDGDDR